MEKVSFELRRFARGGSRGQGQGYRRAPQGGDGKGKYQSIHAN
jgi:hypothetical protein